MKKVWFLNVDLVIAFVNLVKLSFVFSHGFFMIFSGKSSASSIIQETSPNSTSFPRKKFSGKKISPSFTNKGESGK